VALRVEEIDLAADRELVERWQAGEQAAFDDLYRRYFSRLATYCQRRVGDRDTAEEIAQEAFVKALQALPRFAGERRFYPWMTVIAQRLCVDHHRRNGRVRPSDEIDAGSVDGDHGARLAFLADVDNLDRAMQRLGPRHAEVLDLRERRGMSYAEIAGHLEVPQSTVEALLFRARKALRREFLAVSGEGRLATLPVIGIVWRRLVGVRSRIGDLVPTISQLSGPVAAGAMAAVITATPFVASNGPAVPVRTLAPVTTVATTSAPTAPAVTVSTLTPATAPVRPRPSTAAAPVEGVETVPSDEARKRASDMPVVVDAGAAGLGVDPHDLLDWVDTNEED